MVTRRGSTKKSTDKSASSTNLLSKSELIELPIEQLHLDPENPRLPASVKNSSEKEIVDFLLKTANVLELMTSIAEKGFFPGEPLLAVKIDTKSSPDAPWYEVVEGNRRLTAVKLINNPDLASIRKAMIADIIQIARHKPLSVPVVVFNDKQDIVEYLGYRHITGVKAWDSLSKARYMESLLPYAQAEDIRGKYKEIARIIGSKPNYVARILSGLQAYKLVERRDFFDLPGVNSETIAFSLFTTALSYSEIARYIGIENTNNGFKDDEINISHLKNLVSWIFQEKNGSSRVGESRNLSKLAKVVAEEKALAAFTSNQKTLDEALMLTDEPRDLLDSALNEAAAALNLANATWISVEDLKYSDIESLNEIRSLAAKIRNAIQSEIDNKDDE